MSKKGVSAVSGITSPVIGEKNLYNIASWYSATPIADRNSAKVTWELFKKRSNGKFTTTNIKKSGRSDFTFGQTAAGETYRLEAYLYNAEGGGLIITPKPAKIPKINKVELFYVDDTKGTLFSYIERLRAKANCVNMLGKELVFTLWEDDANGGGHNSKNLLVDSKPGTVNKNGVAIVDFMLTQALMQKAMRGEQDGQLEFYVTVEYFKNNKHSTNNVNVKGIPISPPKEQPKPKVPPKAKGSPAESKPASKKEEVGILETISKKWDELWDWGESKGTAMPEKPPTVEKPSGKSTAEVKEENVEKKKEDDVCECEARVRAFMRMLRVKEGTSGEKGYTTQYSGKQFSNLSKHPEEVIKAGYSSSAAGAYQIMADTWKNLTGYFHDKNKKWVYSEKSDKAKKYNVKNFDQESQDKLCLIIMKHNYLQDRSNSFYNPTIWKDKAKNIHDTVAEAKSKEWRKRFKGQQGDIIQMIINNEIEKATLLSSLCWSSLPDSPYGQQSKAYTFAMVKSIYDKNLKEELIAVNPELHLKKGFLKEFGYGCCGGETAKEEPTISKCPKDCSQCFDYSDVINNPRISNQSDNVNKNRYHRALRFNKKHPKGYYHTGVDILAKLDTDLKSMLCGKIVEALDTGGELGKIVTVKSKTKTGKIIWIRYCHLNSISVKKDNLIEHGRKIGKSGNTGNAKGVLPQFYHVHIEASTNGVFYGGNTRVDPEQFMKTQFDETKKGNPIK